MSDPLERLQTLLEHTGYSLEDTLGRSMILGRTRELPRDEARAFFTAALEHPNLGIEVERELTKELEAQRFVELAGALAAREDAAGAHPSVHRLALEALAAGSPCVCDVYAEHAAGAPSPLMESDGAVAAEHPQVEVHRYRCTECGRFIVHRQEHHERGATLHRWIRPGE